MADGDYALLVGISRYADAALPRLNGPLNDVRVMQNWLVAADSGGVPPANVTCIVSDESSPEEVGDSNLPPGFQDFLDAFLHVVRKPDRSGYLWREGSRLYLYFSGHGFCEKHRREAHAALYAANADRDVTWNIYGTYFAQWVKDQGLFGEIVLLMDCCRDAELVRLPLVPPLRKATDVGAGNTARLFEVYAAPRGGKAQERAIASRNNEVHGLLTSAFLDALAYAAPGSPDVTCQDIKSYLEEQWFLLCGDEPADPPEVYVPANGEIHFQRSGPANLQQRFTLRRLTAGGSFEIIDAGLVVVAHVHLSSTEALVERDGAGVLRCPIEDRVLVICRIGRMAKNLRMPGRQFLRYVG